ncbi:MAG: CinA family protein [Promethearchaeota archaeon]|jgi:nicotinamide-nucleotide amidase
MDELKRIERLIQHFTNLHIKIAIAESCTGGFISHMFTNISGASRVFERGIVCYSNESKMDLLNIDPKSLEINGAVSEHVVRQLASNIRTISGVTIGLGISGIAGPTGGTLEKPVGTVFIGYSTEEETKVERHNFSTDRIEFKKKVLGTLLDYLEMKFAL